MDQNYKIFVNDIAVFLVPAPTDAILERIIHSFPDFILVKPATREELGELIEVIEKKPEVTCFIISGEQFRNLKEAFFSFYKYKYAAGGAVRNEKDEILMIYRNNRWDLPKGKIEKEESNEVAAIREVQEETGIRELEIIRPLGSTFHTFTRQKKRYFKQTIWFEMKSTSAEVLEPQLEEGITEVRWAAPEEVRQLLNRSYDSIADVIEKVL